jgi:hypothetical protein
MKRVSVLFFALFMAVFTAVPTTANEAAKVPEVEKWQEIHFVQDSNNDPDDKGAIYIRWFKDPDRADYAGMVVYQKAQPADVPFIKAWNFKSVSPNGEYDFTETLVALFLNDGSWFVGSEGERLKVHREYNDERETVSIEYRFDGQHSSVFKKINLQ